MKTLLKKLFYSIALFFILVAALLTFLFTTSPGLYTAIQLSDLFIPGNLKVHQLSGRLLDQFTIGELDYQNEGIQIKAHNVAINWKLRHILQQELLLNSVQVDSLEINGDSAITSLNNIKLHGVLNPTAIQIDTISFDYLNQIIKSQLRLEGKSPNALSAQIKINPGTFNPLRPQGTIDISGFLNQIEWTGEIKGPMAFSVKGSLKNKSELNQIIKWRDYEWKTKSNQSLYSPEGRLRVSGRLPALKMELNAKFNNLKQDYWQILTTIEGTPPLQWNINATLSRSASSTVEGLYTSLLIKGKMKDKRQAKITTTLKPGRYQLANNSMIPAVEFTGGALQTILSAKSLTTVGELNLDPSKKLKINVKLPNFDLDQGFTSTQKIQGELTLAFNSLDFLQNLSTELDKLQGRADASLKLKGTLGKTIMEGALNLQKVSFGLPKLGINVDSLDLEWLSKKNKWTTKGTLASAGNKLLLTGQGPLNTAMKGELRLEGNNFTIMNTDEYHIQMSPQFNISLTPNNMHISGKLLLPSAEIKPRSFSNSQSLSEDVVYKTKQDKQAPSSFTTSMDIQVDIANAVELNTKGLHANLGGTIKVNQAPQGPINANGELLVSNGSYKAYGQDLTIEQGQLVYTGGRIDNPGINLKASKIIENSNNTVTGSNQMMDFNTSNAQSIHLGNKIKVGVEVTGRLTAPKILLFSNPAVLSQADILSMLVLGRPASAANKAGGQLLMAAVSSMNIGGDGTNAAQLLQQLKQNYGLDFNVQTNSNYNQQTKQMNDSTAVVVGKTLSKRLYLSYNVGLSQADPNVLTLKYLLNRFFSLQVSSSENANGIDLLYSRSKDKLNE